jgi:hypothetical protein
MDGFASRSRGVLLMRRWRDRNRRGTQCFGASDGSVQLLSGDGRAKMAAERLCIVPNKRVSAAAPLRPGRGGCGHTPGEPLPPREDAPPLPQPRRPHTCQEGKGGSATTSGRRRRMSAVPHGLCLFLRQCYTRPHHPRACHPTPDRRGHPVRRWCRSPGVLVGPSLPWVAASLEVLRRSKGRL